MSRILLGAVFTKEYFWILDPLYVDRVHYLRLNNSHQLCSFSLEFKRNKFRSSDYVHPFNRWHYDSIQTLPVDVGLRMPDGYHRGNETNQNGLPKSKPFFLSSSKFILMENDRRKSQLQIFITVYGGPFLLKGNIAKWFYRKKS